MKSEENPRLVDCELHCELFMLYLYPAVQLQHLSQKIPGSLDYNYDKEGSDHLSREEGGLS